MIQILRVCVMAIGLAMVGATTHGNVVLTAGKAPLVTEVALNRYGASVTPEHPVVRLILARALAGGQITFDQIRASDEFFGLVMQIFQISLSMYVVTKGAEAIAALRSNGELIFSTDFHGAVATYCEQLEQAMRAQGFLPVESMKQQDLEDWWRKASGGKGGVIAPSLRELQSQYQQFLDYLLQEHCEQLLRVCTFRYQIEFAPEFLQAMMAKQGMKA